MKRTIKITIICFVFLTQNTFAQIEKYVSTLSDGRSIEITLTVNNDVTLISKHEFQSSDNLGSRLYNLTDLEMIDDGKFKKFDIPEDNEYWFIPFEDVKPNTLLRKFAYYECCGNCSSGACNWYPAGGNCVQCVCNNGSSSSCDVTVYNKVSTGGGILLKANRVEVR